MAEGLARAFAPGATFVSAGTQPGDSLNAESVAALAEVGVDMSEHAPQQITDEMIAAADVVVVLGEQADVVTHDGTPVVRWVLDEPSERGVVGMERMRLVRDEIAGRVRDLLSDHAGEAPVRAANPYDVYLDPDTSADLTSADPGIDDAATPADAAGDVAPAADATAAADAPAAPLPAATADEAAEDLHDEHLDDTIERLPTRAGRRRASRQAPPSLRAVVTGASSGIGRATVELLRAAGWEVFALARRADRLSELAVRTGATAVVCDVTDDASVAAAVARVTDDGPLNAVVNVAGGALGTDSVADADLDRWRRMYETNVLGTLRLTRALLPSLRESGRGDVVVLTSTAAHDTYPGGAGYVAAKHAERVIASTLRLELVGEPVRVMEIAPGMVATEEFSLVRYDGDAEKAAAVYAGVESPLVAEDVADAIVWTLTRPHHVNIDSMIIRPRAQASNTLVARREA